MKNIIRSILEDSIAVKLNSIQPHFDHIIRAADMLAECIAAQHKILIFGNGGSAADAQHFAAEFVNRFNIERAPLAALALSTDTSVLTSIANDYQFDDVFHKQLLALGRPGDIAWGISTSGHSANVLKGLETAQHIGLTTLAMTGPGGKMAEIADLVLSVQSTTTARIQETHITMGHILCDLVDRILFPQAFAATPD